MWNLIITAVFGAVCIVLIAMLVNIELHRYRLLKKSIKTIKAVSKRKLPTAPRPKNG